MITSPFWPRHHRKIITPGQRGVIGTWIVKSASRCKNRTLDIQTYLPFQFCYGLPYGYVTLQGIEIDYI